MPDLHDDGGGVAPKGEQQNTHASHEQRVHSVLKIH
jgi:hypothetical protein